MQDTINSKRDMRTICAIRESQTISGSQTKSSESCDSNNLVPNRIDGMSQSVRSLRPAGCEQPE